MTSHVRSKAVGAGVWRALLIAGPLLVAGSGCRERTIEAQVPLPTVTVVEAQAMDVPIEVTTIGTTRAIEEVTIRARVAGFLMEQHFREGSNVAQGDLLFVIDEEPFKAQLAMARGLRDEAAAALAQAKESKGIAIAAAQLAVSQAKAVFAQVEETRSARLLQRNSLTREEYDQRKAELQQAQADVQAKQAELEQARVAFTSNIALAEAQLEQAESSLRQAELDLGYCRMTAPINGRIGEAKVNVGNYVDPAKDGELATIQQLDPMGVDIQPSSKYLPEVTALLQDGITVNLLVQGDRKHPHNGTVFFVDNAVDSTTSTFLMRATVPNPEETLLPGDYVKVASTLGTYVDLVVVPERAVIETQAGPLVYLVNEERKVVAQPVVPIDLYRGLRVIEQGLKPGEKVIVAGIQLVRPGQEVQTETTELKPQEPRQAPSSSALTKRQRVLQQSQTEAPAPEVEAGTTPAAPKADETPAAPKAEEAPAESKADETKAPPA